MGKNNTNTDPDHEGDRVGTRYRWSIIKDKLGGRSILDVGCAHGDGCTFIPTGKQYVGVDINTKNVCYEEKHWPGFVREAPIGERIFHKADFRQFVYTKWWDCIVAMEVLEHLEDGKEWAQRLKEHCKRLLISVPENRDGQGEENNGHVLRNLTVSDFPGFHHYASNSYSMFLMWDKEFETK